MTNKEQKYRKTLEEIASSVLVADWTGDDAYYAFSSLRSLAAVVLDEADKENFDDIPV